MMTNKSSLRSFVLASTLLILAVGNYSVAQEPTAEQAKKIAKVEKLMDEAGVLYKADNFRSCTTKVKAAKRLISELVASGSEEILKLLESDYGRVAKAQELLMEKNQKLDPLLPLKDMGEQHEIKEPPMKEAEEESAAIPPTPPAEGEDPVSFTKEVAPILVQRCGQCHVKGKKGGFSAANFTAIKKGSIKKGKVSKVYISGDPSRSSLVTLIESGKMPPKSQDFPPEELQTIKDWIAQGATYDGNSEDDKLLDYAAPKKDGDRDQRDRRSN